MITPYNPNNKETSRKLRRKPTPAERRLWERLRRKQLGFIFHRQKPIGDYIVDFYCPEAKLVIEVDGGYHKSKIVSGNDLVRDEVIRNLDIVILHFRNEEILRDTDRVVNVIQDILLGMT